MNVREVLETHSHRPWKMPKHAWSYYQEWNRAVFLHWKVDSDFLKKYIPKNLTLDEFDGKAWVSLVAFDMINTRPRLLPSFPPISNFHEINIRTYVKFNNKPGVYFLSIEGQKDISCKIARKMSQLPYSASKMKRNPSNFWAENTKSSSKFELEYEIGIDWEEKTEHDKFLTERYALFQDARNYLNQYEIHHIEWPIQTLKIKNLKLNYPKFGNLLSNEPDLSHYSPGVQVVAWNKTRFPI